mmetsp:Transcript_1941/g.4802  ORF Transcript_1941/g.4802 Transcript_1941/m.4802 type:complete len:203 (+) Transcript_1941:2092-2700(+)
MPLMTPKPFGPSNIPLAKKPRIGDVPTILHKGVMSAVAASKMSVSLLGPFMYLFKSTRASLNVLRVCVDSSSTAATVPGDCFLILEPPPRISSHRLTMVRSTGEMGDCWELWCFAREMTEFSIPDLDAIPSLAEPPRATTDEADTAEEDAGAESCEGRKSECLPALMKMRAENATARLANFFLNFSRFDVLLLLLRILCEIL